MLTFYGYPRCGTCRQAQNWLEEHSIPYQFVHIVESPPSKPELQRILEQSGLPISKLFNTSGRRYRELGMKDKLKDSSNEELLDWLSSDGMLIKRPIVTDHEKATVGFNVATFEQVWGA